MSRFYTLFSSTCATVITIITTTLGAMVVSQSPSLAFTLSNGLGDGTITVGVDGYGSFGSSAAGVDTTDAFYDPLGAGTPAQTVYESAVAIRFGSLGTRQFLSTGSITGSGGLVDPGVTGTPTSALSSFLIQGLSFNLTQTLTALFTSGTRTGTLLTQTYAITNTGTGNSAFELVRYLDADLLFDGSLNDGGGRLAADGREVLFETDSATGANDETTFVGILTNGGTDGDFEIDGYPGLAERIIAGEPLDNAIAGDGNNNGFIDAGPGYDVTLALSNLFSLGANGSATYTTATIFGTGAPEAIVEPPDEPAAVPEPASILGLLAVSLYGAVSLKRKPFKAST
ncbi:MAG: PEP-CTERM sorting domain-containing protein [Oculatellaceae cyanobacterium bins.114]|nr:PEP-CTERM sorting domain-containing protein [Oculatellaceae cyanobacterium bins.114]